MEREQLTNVETEAQCHELAFGAMTYARKYILEGDNHPQPSGYWENSIIWLADRIIALRSQQVTP